MASCAAVVGCALLAEAAAGAGPGGDGGRAGGGEDTLACGPCCVPGGAGALARCGPSGSPCGLPAPSCAPWPAGSAGVAAGAADGGAAGAGPTSGGTCAAATVSLVCWVSSARCCSTSRWAALVPSAPASAHATRNLELGCSARQHQQAAHSWHALNLEAHGACSAIQPQPRASPRAAVRACSRPSSPTRARRAP